MKKTSRFVALFAALCIAASVTSCGSNSAISADDTSSLEQSDVASVESDDDEETEETATTTTTVIEVDSDDADDTTSTTATNSTAKVGATTSTTKKSSTTTTTKKTTTTTTTTTAQSGTAVTIDLGNGKTTTVYATYHSAKSILSMMNSFRTSKTDAWLWRSNGIDKYYYNQTDTASLGTLTWDTALEKVAKQRAAELGYNYSHTRPNGQNNATLATSYGYSGTVFTENIAAGFGSVEAVFEGWKEENADYSGQGHRRYMLSPKVTKVGVGWCTVNGRNYWVMVLGF